MKLKDKIIFVFGLVVLVAIVAVAGDVFLGNQKNTESHSLLQRTMERARFAIQEDNGDWAISSNVHDEFSSDGDTLKLTRNIIDWPQNDEVEIWVRVRKYLDTAQGIRER